MNSATTTRDALLRRLAWTGFLLMVLVTTSSAYLRLRAAGLGCDEWPDCYGRPDASTLQGGSIALARVAHRVSASAAGLLALLMVALAQARRPRDRAAVAAGVLLVVLAAALAWLGRSTPQARVPAVAMGNLVGGMCMSALFLFLALRRERAAGAPTPLPAKLIFAALALTLLQLAYGAMTSASYSGLACTTLPDCAGAWWPVDAQWSAFDPWRGIASDTGTANMTLHMIHRYGGVLLGVTLLALGWRLFIQKQRGLGLLLVVLVLAQWLIGIGMISASLPVPLALLHNVLAGLLLVALAAVLANSIGREYRREDARMEGRT